MGERKRTEKTKVGSVGVLLSREDALRRKESIDVKFVQIGEAREKLVAQLRKIETEINRLNTEAVVLSGERRLLLDLLEGENGNKPD